MTIRETILIACLVALGAVRLRDEIQRDRARLAALVRRERASAAEVQALRQRGHALRLEARALESDRYYVERVARADLRWRPAPGRTDEAPPSAPPPDPSPAPGARPPLLLVQSLPSLVPDPSPAPGTRPPPVQAEQVPMPVPQPPVDQPALALLGYDSVERFQRKMMQSRPSGVLDESTAQRARELLGLVRRLGYDSVKGLQARNGLTPDGVLGKRTERRAVELLRQRSSGRPASYLAENGRRHRPGG